MLVDFAILVVVASDALCLMVVSVMVMLNTSVVDVTTVMVGGESVAIADIVVVGLLPVAVFIFGVVDVVC